MKIFGIIFLLAVHLSLSNFALGQLYKTEQAYIAFFSEAPLENIDAKSTEAQGIFRASDASIVFQVPIKSFQFKKSLMQEHFNENYMESDKYPNATFKGKLEPYIDKPGQQNLKAKGELTIHGVTRNVSIDGVLEKKGNEIIMKAKFPVALKDHNIKVPKIVMFNIAEVIDVEVEFLFKEDKPSN